MTGLDRTRLDGLLNASTPSLALPDPETGCTIWVKLEYQMPSGSTKDRLAAWVLAEAVESGVLHDGSVVVEASSGSTSIAFAMACARLGVRFRAVMPEGVSDERLLIIRRYGGEVVLTPAAAGLPGSIAETEAMERNDPAVWLPRQFTNPENARAHQRATGPELAAQVGMHLHGFVAAVGTGGTLMGVGRALRSIHPGVVIGRVRVGSGDVDGEQGGPCGIPGVVDCLSGLLDESELGVVDDLVVDRFAALDTTRELCRLGLPVGPSSGLNVAGARLLAARLGPGHHVATVLCDRMERYFSTDLFADIR